MKNNFKKILTLLTTFLICLIFGEILTRIFFPQQLIYENDDIWRPDSTFGWRHQENANTTVNTGEKLVHFRTDENGYRINLNNDSEDSNQQKFSILFLGDSFIEALQVENEETCPQLLKLYLSSKYHLNITIYNSAVSDWDPNHYFLEARKALAEKKIDLGIVCLYVANDIVKYNKLSYGPRQPEPRHKLKVPNRLSWSAFIDSIFYPINDFFKVRSHLFILAKYRSQLILSNVGLTACYFPEIFYISEQKSDRWEITAEICKNIFNVFSNHDAPIIFILLPAPYQVHEEVFAAYVKGFNIPLNSVDLQQPNRLLLQSFNNKSITFVDPLNFMRKKAKNGLQMYGKIDNHFNANGHIVLTDFLLPIVEKYIRIQGG